MRRLLLACGIASSVLYLLAIDVAAAVCYSHYHDYSSQMVSELIARGAPSRPLMVAAFVPYNLLVFGFAGGVWMSGQSKRAVHLAGIGLAGYGLTSSAGLLAAPMDLRTAGLTNQTVFHIWITILQGVFMLSVFVAGCFIGGRRFRLLSAAALGGCLGFGAWAGELATSESPWIGLTERVSIYAWMLWLIALAVQLMPTGRRERASNNRKPAGPNASSAYRLDRRSP